MFLKLDPGSGVPIYRQIMDGVRYSVAGGTLATGDRLPSVRDLATSLGVNPTTIQKAYGELEHLGVIETRRGQGTFVAEGEIRAVVAELRKRGRPRYEPALLPGREAQAEGGEGAGLDELFGQAVEILLGEQRGSVSLLQRRLSIGYSRAARIVQQMAEIGILGAHEGAKPRPCRITLDDWREVRARLARGS